MITFPITEIKRPKYIASKRYNGIGVGLGIMSQAKTPDTSVTFSIADSGAGGIALNIGCDEIMAGKPNGTKSVYNVISKTNYSTSGSWSSNYAFIITNGFDEKNNKFYMGCHPTAYMAEIKYNQTTHTGSNTFTYVEWPASRPQYINQGTYAKGKTLMPTQGGANTAGGKVWVYNPVTSSSIVLELSGSNSRLATPVYDVRRDIYWVANAYKLYGYNANSLELVETRSWSIPSPTSINTALFYTERDEVWVSGYMMTSIYTYNLSNNITGSFSSSLFGTNDSFYIAPLG